MRIAVFGVGGVGGFFGGRLASAGEEVVFIARGAQLKAIKDSGLKIDGMGNKFTIKPAQVHDDPKLVGSVDVILLGVKAWQVSEAAHNLKTLLGVDTFVVPLQNGVLAAPQLAEVLGKEHVVGGLCQISARIAAPGHIQHLSIEPYVAFGELNNQSSQRTQNLRDAFNKAGVKAEIPTDIHLAVWRKYLFIAPVSGIGAVTRSPAHIFRSIPETREMLIGMMNELVAVARSKHITLSEDDVRTRLTFIDTLAVGVIASMQRDIIEGRPSELEAIIGALAQMGKELGIPTPISTFIYHSLLPQEIQARRQITS